MRQFNKLWRTILDVAIRNILQRSDLDPHGKAKLYTKVLQIFFTIVKTG